MDRFTCGYRGLNPKVVDLATPDAILTNCHDMARTLLTTYRTAQIPVLVTVEASDLRGYYAMVVVHTPTILPQHQSFKRTRRAPSRKMRSV